MYLAIWVPHSLILAREYKDIFLLSRKLHKAYQRIGLSVWKYLDQITISIKIADFYRFYTFL
jgi:hypothetical protein